HPGFEDSRRLVTYGWNNGQNAGGLPYSLIERIADEASTLAFAAGQQPAQLMIGADREPAYGEMVTREFFGGVRPRVLLGRCFVDADHDPGGEPVAVISYRQWQERFGGKPNVLGTTIEVVNQSPPRRMVNGRLEPDEVRKDYRIVGVMSPRFTGALPPQMNSETSIWIPFENHVDNASGEPFVVNMIMRGLGRSAPGARPEAIIGELSSKFQSELETALPLANMRFDVIDGLVFNVNVHRSTQRQLLLFLSGSVLLALVAAANVSLFLLARAPGRRRELGIRMSVGAPLRRIARQLATEAVVLVAAAAVLGLVLSLWLAELLRGSAMLRNAQWRDVTLFDWRVLVLVGAFLLVVAAVVSLAPIAGPERLGIGGSSRQGAARATPAQRIAGTAQIAVAAIFGGTALAFGWYLATLMLASPGYATRDLVAVRYSIPQEAIVALNNGGGNIMQAFMAELARQREVF